MDYIELKKLPDVPDSADSKDAWLWAKFIASESEEEMAELAKQNESIEQGRQILVKLSAEENAEYQAFIADLQERDYISSMDGAREEGLAEGKRDGARLMKADGMEFALIEKYTGLSREEIEEL